MAGFDPNTLRAEEQRGGFEPGAPEDDTFHLESLDAYPGNKPDSAETVTDIADEAAGPEDDIFSEPMSVEEALKFAADEEEGSPAAEELQGSSEPAAEAEAEPEESIADQSTDEAPAAPDVSPPAPVEEAPAEEVETPAAPTPPTDETMGMSEGETAQSEAVVLGEELRALLMDDLAKAEERRKSRSSEGEERKPEDAVLEKAEAEGNLEMPEELGEDAFEMDLGDLKLEKHPSQVGTQPDEHQSEGEAAAAVGKSEEKAQKKRPLLPWIASAAAILLVAAIGFAAWQMFLREDDSATAGLEQPEEQVPAAAEESQSQDDAHGGGEETGNGDETQTAAHSGDGEDTGQPTDSIDAHILAQHVQDEPETHSADSGDHGAAAPQDHTAAAAQAANVRQEHGYEGAEEHPDATAEHRNPAAGPEADPLPVQARDRGAAPVREAGQQRPERPRKHSAGTRGEFVVQVYASPSLEDAEEWLQRVQQKPVENAFITTQKIRNTLWYRVRFGVFSSQKEAESKARALGFEKSWVLRIR